MIMKLAAVMLIDWTDWFRKRARDQRMQMFHVATDVSFESRSLRNMGLLLLPYCGSQGLSGGHFTDSGAE